MPSFIKKFQLQKSIAAIDLGSNALRAIIVRKTENELEVIKNFRDPLRLGEDVFAHGNISLEKMQLTEDAFIRLLHSFTEYNVTEVSAMATSAMRDSKNGTELVERIQASTGIKIKTIKGIEEARLIFEAVKGQILLSRKIALLMDIGGGSTELTIALGDHILGTHSFNVGTVRLIQVKNQQELKQKIQEQVSQMLKFIQLHLGSSRPELLIGTGGNLRRIGKIRKKFLGKSTSQIALFPEIRQLEKTIISMSNEERKKKLELDQNRADVITPAIMLTQHLMGELGLKEIHLPKVGLKEGIILSMLETPPKKFILKD
jgi:exopolyphosphatase / guanosine-5'-triphosphate,3'-diphosphate pyrophosphatase